MRVKRNIFLVFVLVFLMLAQPFSGLEGGQTQVAEVSAQSVPYTIYLPAITNPVWNIFGVTLDRITVGSGFDLAADAGVTWVRRDFPWELVEPVENARNWSAISFLDDEFKTASQNMVRVVAIIGGTPDWAAYPGVTCGGRVSADKFAALARFAADAVKRYSAPPYNVLYWELWNEPDVDNQLGCWGNSADTQYYGGSYYGEMLKVVYPAMKAANPDVQVMVGGLLLGCDPVHPPVGKTCTESRFLEGILKGGAGNSFDGVSFHGYDHSASVSNDLIGQYSNSDWASSWNTTGPVTLKKAAYLRDLLTRFGVSQKFLINSEIALLCGSTGSSICSDNPAVEATKAYYVVQAYAASLADGYVASIWYSATGGRGNGLLTSDLTPLPAYYSYQFTASELSRATYVKKPTLSSGTLGYEFKRNNTTIWIVWATGATVSQPLPSMPSAVYRIGTDGHALSETPAISIPIGIAPVIIEFPG